MFAIYAPINTPGSGLTHKLLLTRAKVPATLAIEHGPALHVAAGGDWVISEVAELDVRLRDLSAAAARSATIDARQITHLDTAGSWLLLRTQRALEQEGLPQPELLVPPHYADLIGKVRDGLDFGAAPSQRTGSWLHVLLDRVGCETMRILAQGYQIVGFLGQISIETTEAILQPQRVLPWPALATQIEDCGLTALPILGLLAFLLGIVIAYQGAGQLKRFGAEIYTVNLLGVAVLREIGGLIAAIIVAGRSGSAFTAQIGTMRVNDEIDAMQTMGLNLVELLVLPRVLALMIVLPLLTLYADMMGLFGGYIMTYSDLGLTFPAFLTQLQSAVTLSTLMVGLIKAPVFAAIIGLVGCFEGLRVERNAESVGRLTTRSVVESIFLVIVFDAGFSILFSVLRF